jgi:hypothetical protein
MTGHFCYACEEYFHDLNPLVKEHVGCLASNYRQVLGICADSREFASEITLFDPRTTDHELFCIRRGYAYVGYKLLNGNFHYKMIPYTEPEWSQKFGSSLTSPLPGVDNSQVKPSSPQMVKESFL